MVDDQNEGASSRPTQREAQEALEKQVAQLKREINKINRTLAERAEEAVEEVTGWYDSAADSASRTTQALRNTASTVSGVVQENPGTVSSAFILGGILGGAVGLLLGLALATGDQRRDRWFS
jgi:predicted  nucleic acid-binding Zn-ribbon protein